MHSEGVKDMVTNNSRIQPHGVSIPRFPVRKWGATGLWMPPGSPLSIGD